MDNDEIHERVQSNFTKEQLKHITEDPVSHILYKMLINQTIYLFDVSERVVDIFKNKAAKKLAKEIDTNVIKLIGELK